MNSEKNPTKSNIPLMLPRQQTQEQPARIEPTFGELSDLAANDSHGRAVDRFQQAQIAVEKEQPVIWQNKPPQRSWIFNLLKRWAKPFLKIQRVPEKLEAAPFDIEKPVLYVLEYAGLSNLLILDIACDEAGWPSPMQLLPLKHKERGYFALTKRRGGWFTKARVGDRQDRLERLLADLQSELGQTVQLVPVSVFVGRAPDRTTGWFKVLFADDWVVVGRLRRLLGMLFNGRTTLVQLAEPVNLTEMRDQHLEANATPVGAATAGLKADARKLSRILGVHFRRIRAAVVGPDLSHRRLLLDSVLSSHTVQAAIKSHVLKERVSFEVAESRAKAFFWETASRGAQLKFYADVVLDADLFRR